MKTIHYYLISLGVLFVTSLLIGTVWNNSVSPVLRALPKSVKISVKQTRTTLPNTPAQKNTFLPIDNPQNVPTSLPPARPVEQAGHGDTILPAATPNGTLPTPKEHSDGPYATLAQSANEAPSTVTQKDNGTMALEKPAAPSGLVFYGGKYPQSLKSEDLYKASMPAIKAILAAQKEYFAKNNKYTINPQDLNLDFAELGNTVKTESRTALQFKNGFTLILGSGFLGVIYNWPALPAAQLFNIDFFYNGNATCYARTMEAGQSCRALGGDFPRANKMLPNIIEYYLPKDFLTKN